MLVLSSIIVKVWFKIYVKNKNNVLFKPFFFFRFSSFVKMSLSANKEESVRFTVCLADFAALRRQPEFAYRLDCGITYGGSH